MAHMQKEARDVWAWHLSPEHISFASLKNSEVDQEIPQSQTADKPMARRGRATQLSQYTRKAN